LIWEGLLHIAQGQAASTAVTVVTKGSVCFEICVIVLIMMLKAKNWQYLAL